jgi:hypothetical protein
MIACRGGRCAIAGSVKVIGWRAEPEWRTAIANIVIQYCRIILIHIGFSESRSVSCVFINWFGTGVFVLVLVYVDDFLTLSPSGVQLKEVYQAIAAIYEIHRMKEVKLYLGVELRWRKSQGGAMVLHMLQPTYIKNMLVRYGMKDSRPASTASLFAPLEAEEDTTVVEQNLYQQIIGSLCLALKTRPDILTVVCILSRFTSASTKYCHMAVKRVFRYLQGTAYLALEYCSSDIKMNVFVDSDYVGDTNSQKSTSGMALF